MNDIVLNKKESIERCIKQIRTYYALPGAAPFAEDYLKQDAIALNLQRACELCIDLANHTIKLRKLGLPKESKESFRLLAAGGIIPRDLAVRLEGMVGFRNVLVHEYQKLDITLMIDVIENRLDDLVEFTNCIVREFFDITGSPQTEDT
ncbi:DUF86 domain-containing protein [Geobacter sp.]|uniref:type VII toxin-antitoxin system HepT family RNase toxin n=1 Tax=Geobacter sp. TaxID=46610 RepID=UPI002631472E|nr:DUF86 domain-containing protein [Geobacter sp.]